MSDAELLPELIAQLPEMDPRLPPPELTVTEKPAAAVDLDEWRNLPEPARRLWRLVFLGDDGDPPVPEPGRSLAPNEAVFRRVLSSLSRRERRAVELRVGWISRAEAFTPTPPGRGALAKALRKLRHPSRSRQLKWFWWPLSAGRYLSRAELELVANARCLSGYRAARDELENTIRDRAILEVSRPAWISEAEDGVYESPWYRERLVAYKSAPHDSGEHDPVWDDADDVLAAAVAQVIADAILAEEAESILSPTCFSTLHAPIEVALARWSETARAHLGCGPEIPPAPGFEE